MKKGVIIGLAVGGGVLVVGTVVTLVLVFALSGGGEWFTEFAQHVPNKAVAVVGMEDPGALMARVVAESPKAELDDLRGDAGFDVFDVEAWAKFGWDASAPVGFALVDPRSEAWLLSYGSPGEAAARKGIEAFLEEQVGDEDVELEEEEFGELKALVADPKRGPVFMFAGDRVLVVGGSRLQKYPNADDAEEGLTKLAKKVAKLEPDKSLATDEALTATMAQLDDQAVIGWLAAKRLIELFEDEDGGDDEETDFLLNLAKEARGAAGGLAWEDDRVGVTLRIPMKDTSRIRAIFEGPARSANALGRIPAPVVAGNHLVLNLAAVKELAGDALELQSWAEGQLEEMTKAADDTAGIDLEDVADNFTGEMGAVIDKIPEGFDGGDVRVTMFFGVKDTEKAQEAMAAVYDAAKKLPVPLEDEEVAGVTVYQAGEPIEGFEPAIAVHEGYVWASSHSKQLAEVLEGAEEGMFDDARSAEVAETARDDVAWASWYDLRAVVKQYGGLLGMAGADAVAYAERLDRVDWSVGVDGKDLVSVVNLYIDAREGAGEAESDDDDDEAGGDKGAFGSYMKKAKQTEAIDLLDKIVKGASLYYSTPHVTMEGSLVPCQFPASVACTPSGSACGKPDDRYPADPEAWAQDTWSALNFAPADAHYFQYCVESEGTLADARFKVTARADLDCDGTITVMSRTVEGDPDSSMAECSAKMGPLEQGEE